MLKFNPEIHFKPPEPDIKLPKELEERIQAVCKKTGMELEKLIKNDPDFGKFDAWWIEEDDEKRSLQIKYRELGDDITQELQDNLLNGVLGSDATTRARQILFVNRKGIGHLFENRSLREKLMRAQSQNAVKLLGGRKEQINLKDGVTIKLRKDEYSQKLKCVAIFQPEKQKPISILTFN